jgi:hypothetical protein
MVGVDILIDKIKNIIRDSVFEKIKTELKIKIDKSEGNNVHTTMKQLINKADSETIQ